MDVLVQILVYSLLVSIGLGEVIRFTIFNIEIKPLDLLILTSIPLAVYQFKHILKQHYIKPLMLFVIVGVIGLVLNRFINMNQAFVSFLYLLRFVSIVLWYSLIFRRTFLYKPGLFRFMFGIGIFIVLSGFVQYIYYPNLRNLYYLGWDEHVYRLFSVFLDPNFAACFLAIFFLMFTSFGLQTQKKYYFVGSFITLVALFLTYSRSGLIMLVASSFILLFLIRRKKIIVPIIILLLIGVIFSSRYFYIENLNLFRTASSVARLDSAKEALSIFSKNPLFGVGFNAYRYAQIRYGYRKAHTLFESHADAGTDNSFLFVLATTGIVGFIFYLWFWEELIKTRYLKFLKTKNTYQALVIAVIVGIFIDSLFINTLFYAPILVWVMVLLGVTENI